MTYRYRLLSALTASVLAAAPAAAQNAPPTPTRPEIVSAARTIIGKARYATFVSLDRSGQPQARIVDAFAPEDDFTVWIATNALSRKVEQVAANERVTLLYFDAMGQNYVTAIGTARLVRDAQEKATHWKEAWAGLYKDKNRGDDYVLIRVTPRRLEVVAAAMGMVNDPATWRPVILDLQAPQGPAGARAPVSRDVRAACDEAYAMAKKTPGVSIRRATGVFSDEALRLPVSGCRLVVSGSFKKLKDTADAATRLRDGFAVRGWQDLVNYGADGKDGTAFGFQKAGVACLVRGVWDGGADGEPEIPAADPYKVTVLCTSPVPQP